MGLWVWAWKLREGGCSCAMALKGFIGLRGRAEGVGVQGLGVNKLIWLLARRVTTTSIQRRRQRRTTRRTTKENARTNCVATSQTTATTLCRLSTTVMAFIRKLTININITATTLPSSVTKCQPNRITKKKRCIKEETSGTLSGSSKTLNPKTLKPQVLSTLKIRSSTPLRTLGPPPSSLLPSSHLLGSHVRHALADQVRVLRFFQGLPSFQKRSRFRV